MPYTVGKVTKTHFCPKSFLFTMHTAYIIYFIYGGAPAANYI